MFLVFCAQGKSNALIVPTAVEPSFLALGPYHLCVGMNNRVWFYDLTTESQESGAAPLLMK